MPEQTPTLIQKRSDNHVDYSEMYRTQETLQLNKRLRKTRNVILACSAAFVIGGVLFSLIPESPFATKNLLAYIGVAAVMVILSVYSSKQPFFTIVAALIICLGVWGVEIFSATMEGLLIETSIHKLFIVSLLVWRFHPSREAELIRKELYFS